MALVARELPTVNVFVCIYFIAETLAHIVLPATLIDTDDLVLGDGPLLDLAQRLLEINSDAMAVLKSRRWVDLSDVKARSEVVCKA